MLQLSDVRPISDVPHQREGWRPPYPEDLQNRSRISDRIRTFDASDVRHMTDVRHEGPREELPIQDTSPPESDFRHISDVQRDGRPKPIGRPKLPARRLDGLRLLYPPSL